MSIKPKFNLGEKVIIQTKEGQIKGQICEIRARTHSGKNNRPAEIDKEAPITYRITGSIQKFFENLIQKDETQI